MNLFDNQKEKIIEFRIRGLLTCEDTDELARKYVLECLMHKDKEMRAAISVVVKKHFKQYEGLVHKYSILL